MVRIIADYIYQLPLNSGQLAEWPYTLFRLQQLMIDEEALVTPPLASPEDTANLQEHEQNGDCDRYVSANIPHRVGSAAEVHNQSMSVMRHPA